MSLRKLGAAILCLGMMVSADPSQARPVGTVDGMPFFGIPYPYGYVYHRPIIECYAFQQVATPEGLRILPIWICGAPVTAKY